MTYKPVVEFKKGVIIPDDKLKGEIEFRNVTFEYPTKKDVQVLQNMSF